VATANDGVLAQFVTTTDTAMESAWHHYAAVFPSTSSRTPYLDGVAGTTDTTSLASFNTFDNLRIGRALDNTKGMLGYIGHVAVWKSALSSGQIASLAAGANPQTIDSANLVAYYPMTNAADVGEEIINGYDLTLNGSAAYNSENPTIDLYSTYKPRLMLMGIG